MRLLSTSLHGGKKAYSDRLAANSPGAERGRAMEARARLYFFASVVVVMIGVAISSTYIVEPGFRGVKVTLGKMEEEPRPEGLGFKLPLVSSVHEISLRQESRKMKAECYSADLQQVTIELSVLYRVPESSVVRIYRELAGDPFEAFVAPRVTEALKEITGQHSAEILVRSRDQVKTKLVVNARAKIGELLAVEDIALENIDLTAELERAIEQKMVQEQEAAKAKFAQHKAQIEAETAIIRAKAEAEAMRVRSAALKDSPELLTLQMIERWDGRGPSVVGAGTSFLLPSLPR
jgi:prohibitin 2